jgi:hypothetical protein
MNQAKIDMVKAAIASNPVISLYLVFFCIFLDKAKKERRFDIFVADNHPRDKAARERVLMMVSPLIGIIACITRIGLP